MDTTSVSTDLSQARVLQDVSIAVLDSAIDLAREEGDRLESMLETAPPITDPALGNRVDLLA